MTDTYVFQKELKPNSPWYIDLELRPGELQAIGHVAAQWAVTEYLMREHTLFLSELAHSEPPPNIDNISFVRRQRVWKEMGLLALRELPNDLKDVLSVIERVSSMSHERHQIIHGIIRWDTSNKYRLKIHSGKDRQTIPWAIDRKRVEGIARKIAILNFDILALHNGIDLVPFASYRRSGKPVRVDPTLVDPSLLLSNLEELKPPRRSSQE